MRTGNTHIWLVLLAAAALLIPAAVSAQTPQTIAIDGINDFDGSNLIDADGGDVFVDHTPLDIGDVYITNDAVNLYFGFEQENLLGWGDIQFGIAIDVNTAQGGITDPWGRRLEWSLSGTLPDYIMYVNVDNGWQDLRVWNEAGGTWDSQVAGPGVLGWNTGTGFKELSMLLSTFGVSSGDPINVEYWLTQGTTNKGPLDAAANDASQLSTGGGTTWETTVDIPMLFYHAYTVQASADPNPPLVSGALHLVDSQVDVTFNEPVG
nr:hypothetical protein [bacterium]